MWRINFGPLVPTRAHCIVSTPVCLCRSVQLRSVASRTLAKCPHVRNPCASSLGCCVSFLECCHRRGGLAEEGLEEVRLLGDRLEALPTMHALRLHKAGVPGRDKSRAARRVQQVTRQRAARGNVLQVLRSFLTADAFMYGPLVESPPNALDLSNDDDHSEPHTPEREQEDGGLDENDTNEEENDATSGKHDENGHEEDAAGAVRGHRGPRSGSTKTILSVTQRSTRTAIRGLKP